MWADDPRRAGQPVVRARAHSRTCRTHDLAAPAGDSEVGWSAPERKDYDDFHARVLDAVAWMQQRGGQKPFHTHYQTLRKA